MLERLNKRDKRALKIGTICAVVVAAFWFGAKWLDHWKQARQSLAAINTRIDALGVDKTAQGAITTIVPVFEMPQKEETQKFLFRSKLNEQLKQAGINSKPLQVLPAGKVRPDGYRVLRLKSNAKCKFGQVLDLLAKLNENPYLVGVEEIRVRCDAKNREDVEFDLTVSTFVQ